MSTEQESLPVSQEPAQSKFAIFHYGIQVSKAHPHWLAAWTEAHEMGLVGRTTRHGKFMFDSYTIETVDSA